MAADVFSESESIALGHFLNELERRRAAENVRGWRVTRDSRGCQVEIMLSSGAVAGARADTFREACIKLGDTLIAEAIRGSPEA